MAAPFAQKSWGAAICEHLCHSLVCGQRPEIRRSGSTLMLLQVDRRVLASSINFDVKFKPIALIEFAHTCTLNSADVNESIGLSIIARDEAKALHRVEELDRAGRLFASQLTLRRFCFLFNRDHVTHNRDVAGGNLAAAINQSEFQPLTFGEAFKTGPFDSADVNENVFAATLLLDEAEALVCVEKLYDALALANDLGWHSAAITAAATRGTAEAATASAITAAKAATRGTAAAAAEAITAAAAKTVTAASTEAITTAAAATAGKGVKTAFRTETIPLVAPTSATTSIETHKPSITFASPSYLCPDGADEARRATVSSRRGNAQALLCRPGHRSKTAQMRIDSISVQTHAVNA